jgi:integral membrane protein (TIGR01906 family)
MRFALACRRAAGMIDAAGRTGDVDRVEGQTYDTTNSGDRDAAGRLGQGKRLMPALRYLAAALFILALPVALLTTNIRYVANEGRVYRYSIDQFGAVQATGVDREELLRASAELRRYFNNDIERVDIRVEQQGREILLFNQRETDHLVDVKDRFQLMNRVQEFSLVYILAYIAVVVLWAREVSLRRLASYVAVGATITLVVVGAVGAIGMAGFDSAWEDFHELIFTNDFWLLNPATDRLIQMFPPEFWQSIVFFVGLLAVSEAALLLIAAGIYLGVSKRQAQEAHFEPFYA